jgi:hypothetical protein
MTITTMTKIMLMESLVGTMVQNEGEADVEVLEVAHAIYGGYGRQGLGFMGNATNHGDAYSQPRLQAYGREESKEH